MAGFQTVPSSGHEKRVMCTEQPFFHDLFTVRIYLYYKLGLRQKKGNTHEVLSYY